MYALTDYARFEAISSLPLSGDMLPSALMSKMLDLLPAHHQACFFLLGSFFKRLPSDVRAHLVHIRVEFHPPPPWTMSPLPLMNALFLPFMFHLPPFPVPSVLLHGVPDLLFSDSCFDLKTFWLTIPLLVSSELGRPGPEGSCTLFLVGKLAGCQKDVFSLPAGSRSSSLVYFQDKLSSRHFLVDYGASVSVFPAPASPFISGVKLLFTDGSSVSCSGSRIIPLRSGSCIFDWMFQLAPVSVPILRLDFLHHHNLLLALANQKVFNNSSPGSPAILLPSSPPTSSSPLAPLLSTPKCVSDLLLDFPAAFPRLKLNFSPWRSRHHPPFYFTLGFSSSQSWISILFLTFILSPSSPILPQESTNVSVLHDGPPEGLLPGGCLSRGCPEDRHHHPLRDVGIPFHALWPQKHW